MGENAGNIIDKGPFGSDLIKNIGGYERPQMLFVPGFPEMKNSLHESDDQVAAFHVALFS